MGEISEALKRARDSAAHLPTQSASPAPIRESLAAVGVPLRDARNAVDIPVDLEGDWSGRSVLCAPHSDFAESYRHFAIRLQRQLKERGARSVVVTSAVRAEGKTTTACNLSLALASMASGRRIALLELDVRRPAAARALGVTVRTGIECVLSGAVRIAEACAHTQLPELDLYLANQPVRDALAAIVSPATGALIRDLTRQYDVLVIDAPPVLPVPDVSLIAAHADVVLLVARRGVSRHAALLETITSLGAERIVGAFLNEQRIPLHRRYGASYGYPEQNASSGETE